eukprot:7391408-Prymnesium_polylepis.4
MVNEAKPVPVQGLTDPLLIRCNHGSNATLRMMLRSMTVAHLTWRAESAAQGIELKLRRPLVPAMLHARQTQKPNAESQAV